MTIKLKDVSFADTASHALDSIEIDLSGSNIDTFYLYNFTTKMPEAKFHHRVLTVTVVVNNGWRRSVGSKKWIRPGDYLSVNQHRISFKVDKYDYKNDMVVLCYRK